ncbi:MAG: hypothetical protein U1G07_13610 [Verrucomicrobiota bacterium]
MKPQFGDLLGTSIRTIAQSSRRSSTPGRARTGADRTLALAGITSPCIKLTLDGQFDSVVDSVAPGSTTPTVDYLRHHQ